MGIIESAMRQMRILTDKIQKYEENLQGSKIFIKQEFKWDYFIFYQFLPNIKTKLFEAVSFSENISIDSNFDMALISDYKYAFFGLNLR